MRLVGSLVMLVYLLVGVLVAQGHHYFVDVKGLQDVISVVLAVVLWPLVLLGVNLHLGANGKVSSLPALSAALGAIRPVRR